MQRPLRNSRHPHQSSPRSAPRRAFSLIELMVVMLIVALLMGMLLAAVRGAMNTARVAAVTVEFKNLEKAITDFKAKYGADPPSRILLCENGLHWTTPSGSYPTGFSAADLTRSKVLIRQIWPDYHFPRTAMEVDANDLVDFNKDGDTNDFIGLNGAECLVFFLGGIPDQTGDAGTPWAMLGFSANPEHPFIKNGARIGPFYEFDLGRLVNFDGDSDLEKMPEYKDSLPGQRNPILFASSYGGRGYRDADVQLVSSPGSSDFAYYYRRYTGTYPATPANFNAARAFNEKSYQLISPGFDGEYGTGGLLSGDMELLDPQPARSAERDNITNFKGGTLN